MMLDRIEFEGLLEVLHGLRDVVVLGPFQFRQPLVEPPHGKVVVGAGPVVRRAVGFNGSLRGLRESGATHCKDDQKRFG